MPRSPHPSAAAEEKNSNSIPLMATFPALKVYHCQFCSQIFVTESARRNHNNMEFRDFALAHARMDSVGGASGQAGGARDVMEEASGEAGGARDEVGGAMDEGQEASEETLHLIRDGHGGRGQHTIDSPNPAPPRDPHPHRTVFAQHCQRCRRHLSTRTISPYRNAPHRVPNPHHNVFPPH